MQARVLFLAIALAACGKSEKTATIDLFGKKPVPPGELAKIKPGMTQAEVKALLPSAKPTPRHSGSPSLSIDSGYDNVEYRIGFYGDKDAVANVRVEVPTALAKQLETAWGAGEKNRMGDREWNNPDDGYEVSTMEMRRHTTIRFDLYVPLTQHWFGTSPGPVDALAKIKFGMTREEVTKAVPGLEGPPKGGGSYIPYEAKPEGVRLSVGYDSEDKVDRFEVDMPQRGADLAVKAWGPRPATTRGTGTPGHCWDTADKAMRIQLTPESGSLSYTRPEMSFCEFPTEAAK
jgi:hypothetical protein